ncbi:MAG: hypothetical protein UV57_C0005G0020 [Parcubacteria group bacterium GW2011_GWD2_43_10]|nr:MAG: hypothetical protein UV47_C0038G0005 [Parcubacteria group bacterium GW2011_GWA2_42_80]KKS83865.1 MAG: hypothetical protein UV57_C0005G0020 [Parcubacteria group bacterium GW2011_GWD2_43_10]KKS92444.1 MAG: hypothetical protein UV69_C0031G0006 [Parcubacteria group bacterium GW2011_GWE2_43_12]KKT14266.1 MAG: hypothetical protein UV96_C0036G0006 [Parcubacteria group bacterium GW2011_GWF2_43_38]KKT22231.1 MAG: hypothetical protein UW06_C0015G0022 [Parcubacteria group bacterium GW2011_GWE1_43_
MTPIIPNTTINMSVWMTIVKLLDCDSLVLFFSSNFAPYFINVNYFTFVSLRELRMHNIPPAMAPTSAPIINP